MAVSTTPYGHLAAASLTAGQLAEEIAFCDAAYHVAGESPIADAAYDKLKDLLQQIAPDHPLLQLVGASGGFGVKIDHVRPMLSLDKCTTCGEFAAWYRGVVAQSTGRANTARLGDDEIAAWAAAEGGALVAMPKIDGLACSLRFSAAGILQVAATRGDGRTGEDVTENARQIPTIVQALPQHVSAVAGLAVEVRGEVYVALSVFAAVADQFANPRNLAAGMLKSKESPALPIAQLRFFAYDLLGTDLASEAAKLNALAELGFSPLPWRRLSATQVEAAHAELAAARSTDDFESDGIVVRLDNCALALRLGVTAHHPRAAIAWKYEAQADTTELLDVHWSVARTGTITPVALVAAVVLSGASVTRATLHNVSNLKRLALRRGDRVELVRRGGVIPHVERVTAHSEAPLFEAPAECPSCGGPTVLIQREESKGKSV